MAHTDFDRFARDYSAAIERALPFVPQGHDVFVRAKAEELLRLAADWLGNPARIQALDVGCGIGLLDTYVADRLGGLDGVDVAPVTVEHAQARNPDVRYRSYDGGALPYEVGRFDLVFATGVIHHVPPTSWEQFVGEMGRVTRPGGLIVLLEPNPLNPVAHLGRRRCEFDGDAVFLAARAARGLLRSAGLAFAETRYLFFFPIQSRPTRWMERRLRRVPLGAEYLVSAVRPLRTRHDRVSGRGDARA